MSRTTKDGVQAEIQRLYDERGKVTSTDLVEAAQSEDSPAHAGFEWDDAVAGREYRLNQARRWLRVCTVIYEDQPQRLVHVPRVFTHDNNERDGDYKPIAVVATIPDEFDRALNAAISKLYAARRAVDELRTAASKAPSADRSEMIAQISKGLDLLESAMQRAQ